jgi:hypothetical protein
MKPKVNADKAKPRIGNTPVTSNKKDAHTVMIDTTIANAPNM